MKIEQRKFVSIAYTLKLDSGEVVDRSAEGEPLGFLFGSGQIIPGLESALEGRETGDTLQVTVTPEQGYGLPREELFREIPRENFPEDLVLEPGMGFEASGPHGPVTFRIREVRDDDVVADFNHPLAGERLHFDVTVEDVREARAEELAGLFQGGCDPNACSSCGSSGGCS